MKNNSFKIIYNQDSTNLFFITKGQVTPDHVDKMVDEVADGGGDVFLVNPNAQKVNYPSKVWEPFWEGYVPKDPNVPDGFIQMKNLANECDYLERALQRCRQREITPGVTIRMNDMHDAPNPESHMHSRLWYEHPEFRLNTTGRGWSSTGLNYEYPEVRQRFLTLVDEIVNHYDFEFLELDFMRFCGYFERDNIQQHCKTMNGFMRDVRSIIDDSGKTIALVPKVASTPSYAYSLGHDVKSWAEEELINGITFGMFLNTGWELPVDQFRRTVKAQIPVYPCTDFTAWRSDDGLPVRHLSTDRELLRGFASGAHALGAGGMCLFNFFCARESAWSGNNEADLAFDTFKDLKDINQLRKLPHRNLITTGTSFMFEADLPLQVPVDLDGGVSREFKMLLLALTPNSEVKCIVYLDRKPAANDIFLHINSSFEGCATQVEAVDETETNFQAEFDVAPETIQDGWNILRLVCTGKVTIRSIEIIQQ